MNYEIILICDRNDAIKKNIIYREKTYYIVAVSCIKYLGKKRRKKGKKKVVKIIRKLYEKLGAESLWITDELCDFLQMQRMKVPDTFYKNWLEKISFYPTIIFADDDTGIVQDYLTIRTDKVAVMLVVCYEKYRDVYEEIAGKLYRNEGLVLQILSYETMKENSADFLNDFIQKGCAVVLDFHKKCILENLQFTGQRDYYSFWNDMRLFLDTFQKNRYNTLIK